MTDAAPANPTASAAPASAASGAAARVIASAGNAIQKAFDRLIDLHTQPFVWATRGIANAAKRKSCTLIDCEILYEGQSNGTVANALDHVVVSAGLTHRYGSRVAAALGEAKEMFGPLTNRYERDVAANQKDAAFDRCNNEVGIRIGEYAKEHQLNPREIAGLIDGALKGGKLALGETGNLRAFHNENCKNPWLPPIYATQNQFKLMPSLQH
jgi:hypothetical protein